MAETFFFWEGILEILDINYYFLDEIATRSSFYRILSLLYELVLRCVRIFGRSNSRHELKFRFTMVLELTGRVESTGSKHNVLLFATRTFSFCVRPILINFVKKQGSQLDMGCKRYTRSLFGMCKTCNVFSVVPRLCHCATTQFQSW